MATIIGKTNGANSSEFALLKSAGIILTALVAVGLTGTYISAEQAAQANALIEQLVAWGSAGVMLYTACRTWLKKVVTETSDEPEG